MMDADTSVIWITIDSLRFDHTSLGEYQRDTTPELANIRNEPRATSFSNCFSHSTRTPVSVPSMLTGLHPTEHRLIGNSTGSKLAESISTLPELFSSEGYYTVGISENSYAGDAIGLGERFDEFLDTSIVSPSDIISLHMFPGMVKYLNNLNEHGPGLTRRVKDYGRTNSVFTTAATKRWVSQNKETASPFFCYVHYNDVHRPYVPPRSYIEDFLRPYNVTTEEALNISKDVHKNAYEYMANSLPFSERKWLIINLMYDAVIKYVDSCVGELVDFLQRELEDPMIIITSDHGEFLGEYGLLGHHILLHDAVTRVPLIIYGHDLDLNFTDLVQHIDISKTILSSINADTTQIQGYNITSESRPYTISQDLRGSVEDEDRQNYERILKYNEDFDTEHLPESLVTALRTKKYKLVSTDSWDKLYKIPDEDTDIKNSKPQVYKRLKEELNDWRASLESVSETEPVNSCLDEETRDHLREMGYLE